MSAAFAAAFFVAVLAIASAGPAHAATNDLIDQGKTLWVVHCSQCHGQNLEGGPGGPDLHGIGPAPFDFMMRTGRMPLEVPDTEPMAQPPQLTPRQIAAIVAFAVANGAGPSPQIPSLRLNDRLADGRKLFDDNCQGCHGAQGAGATIGFGWEAPDLYPSDPTVVAEAVRFGPGLMPLFDDKVISNADLNDLVSYVMTFRHPPDIGGYALGHTGPTGEGVVAWFFGLGSTCIVMVLVGQTLRSRQQPNRDDPR
ncbi:MAG: c-type cytochrome [Vulcanimicrobiaceae bacterium]